MDIDSSIYDHLTRSEQTELDTLISMEEPKFCDPNFPEQTAFILDPARLKLLLTSRRAGKSIGVVRYLLKVAHERPKCNVLYIGLTREQAKKTIWKDGLKEVAEQLHIKCLWNEADLTCTLPNGSIIYVIGADANDLVKERIRGMKLALVCLDEAASFGQDLADLYFRIVKPAVADYLGTICLVGTPGNLQLGLFYELTSNQDPTIPHTFAVSHPATASTWSGHSWNTYRNPYMAVQHETEIDEMIQNNPLIVNTPGFQQEKLGRWAIDDEARVYRYTPGFNDYTGLPTFLGQWRYVLGIDLGYEDDTAFLVLAYNTHSPTMYITEAKSQKHMILPQVAETIDYYRDKHKFERIVIDGAAKQAVETLRQMYKIPLTSTEKQGKWDYIQIVNGFFQTQRLYLSPHTSALKGELAKLVKDENTLIPREKPGLPNHLCDSLLYAVRSSYAYLGKLPKKEPAFQSPEWYAAEEEKMSRAVQAGMRPRQKDPGDMYG